MKILIIGSWEKEKAAHAKKEAEEIGKALAKDGHVLISGGGTGISELVVNSYRKHKGKRYVCILPSKKEMEKVGEEIGPKPDEIIDTGRDYPERNIELVRKCDAVIALHGGLGTLTEIIHAVYDYDKKVSVIDKGELIDWIKAIPKLRDKLLITSDIKKAIEYLEKR